MSAANNYKAMRRLDYSEPNFTASDIYLTFNLADACTKVRAVINFQRLTQDRKAPLILDGEDLELNEVLLNGATCQFKVDGNRLIVDDVPDNFELQTEVTISPITNTSLMGLYKSCGTFCTQCEPMGFRRITYFLDRPDVLATYKVKIIEPESGCAFLLSNGNLIEQGFDKGRHYCIWEDPFPKPSYLFALVAGAFDVVEDTYTTKSGRKVSLELYVDRGAYNRGLWAMECIKQSMKWDEDRFNLEYDLDNFKVVAVDFFNQGAMENKSLNIFNSIYVLVDPKSATDDNFFNVQSVIGHEYFHNWTGDRVTLRDWFQLSLKESLTVFRDQEFSSDIASRTLTRLHAINVIRTAQFAEDASPMSHPVRPDLVLEMNNFYTVTIYDKGAEVIRMIHTILGEELFQKGMQAYINAFDGQAVTIEDFIIAMENASKKDLAQFRRWYSQSGTPNLHASWRFNEQDNSLALTLSQETKSNLDQSAKDPFVIPVRISFMDRAGNVVNAKEVKHNEAIILKDKEETFIFKDMPKDVLPVVLRDFSAPVKLTASYTSDDYKLMLEHCDDAFIKVDSGIAVINKYIHDNIDKASNGGELPPVTDLIEAFDFILSDTNTEPLLKRELLKIPSIEFFMETFTQVDLDALVQVRNHIEESIALALGDKFEKLYHDNLVSTPYKYTIEDAAKRGLCNTALHMLSLAYKLSDLSDKAASLCRDHYFKADNLTLKLQALKTSVNLDLSCKEELLNDFADTWSDDPLVFDNFFRIQATNPSEDTVDVVRKLLRHEKYDKTNPNRVRALVGAMALSNPVALHQKEGYGYMLLTDVVTELDAINPMVAARIITPMLSFKRLDLKRQKLAREYLEKILGLKDLSSSVYEKINKALNVGK